jgi:hypothetical protein
VSGLERKFGGGPHARSPGCALPAHYLELQALCDALGHAAQLEMADAIERADALGRELAYGKWLGLRGILRAIEVRSDEWTATEQKMLERIDWDLERFAFPGCEAFDVPIGAPGQNEAGSGSAPA